MMVLFGMDDRKEDKNEDNYFTSWNSWQDVDIYNMLYVESIGLSEAIGAHSKGHCWPLHFVSSERRDG